MSFEIFADSCFDLPEKTAQEFNVIPYIFTLDGKDYFDFRDYRELPIKNFYDALRAGKIATTTQITQHRFLEAWSPFLQDGKNILHMTLSSRLSKTFDQSVLASREAMEIFPERTVITIDTTSASLGQGMLALKAAQAKKDGKSVDETAEILRETAKRIHVWLMADDLHHLKRGGRISGAKAVVGTMLNVKPILTVGSNGRLAPVSKARGRNKAMVYFTEMMEKYEFVKEETFYIAHTDDIELAKQLAEMVTEKFGITDIIIHDVGPIIGAHVGPGAVAMFFFGNDRRVNMDDMD